MALREQRRGRSIALTPEEIDEYLGEQRTCRLATIGPTGAPHVSALWFAWDGTSMWFTSIVRSQRWTNVERDPRVSALVDDGGGQYNDLRGVELIGSVVTVGEVPRVGEPCDELHEPERLYSLKYRGTEEPHHDGRHAWLKLTPEKIVSWDFRKIPG